MATQAPAQTVSPVQTQAIGLSEEERRRRNQQLGFAQQTTQQAMAPLSRYTSVDATGSTPLRRALTEAKTSATTGAYNNLQSASRLRGLQAGLANQPLQYGNQLAIENERAGALSRIPSEVEQEAVAPEMQATGLMNQLAGTQLGIAGQYSPESYFGQGAGIEAQRQQELNENYRERERQRGALWRGLAQMGMSAALAPATGGGSLLGNLGR